MGTNYQAGRRFEWAVRKMFQEQGFTVIRAAGSKSPIDVVAIDEKRKEIHLVQCKYGQKPKRLDPPVADGLYTVGFRLLWKPRGGEMIEL
jgi:Holliday junction resolvase